jgi:WD40 repeat protein
MQALDFQVEIGAGGDRGYEVVVRAPQGGEATALLRLPGSAQLLGGQLGRLQDALLASSASVRRSLTREERPVQEFGRALFDALMVDNVRGLLVASRQQAAREGKQLRVVLQIRPPELARLPWEFLFDAGEDDYLCLETPLVRYPFVLQQQRPLGVTPPLRVLGMVARPGDQQALAIDDEQRRLSRALADLERAGRVELNWVPGQTWRDLQAAMRTGPWHVFHFIGHGGFDANAGEGTLALADDQGRTYPLHASDLAMLLRGHQSLRLVLLNACDTGRASALDPFSSVAGALMRRGIPAVLAMQFEITDQAAVEFSHTFYGAVADQLPVDVSVTEARHAIRLAVPGTLEWGTPVLYLRSPDGYIFDLADAPALSQPIRRPADAAESDDTAVLEELNRLYVDGLGAFYTDRWDRAVEIFRQLVARQRDYKDAAVKLEQARQQQQLALRYTAAREATEVGDWAGAVEHLEAVLAIDPAYQDAAARLENARHHQALTDLTAQALALHRAKQWAAVVAVGERLRALDPTADDPDGLVSSARAELTAEERAHRLAMLYEQALKHMNASAWQQAKAALHAIERLEPGYRDSAELLVRVDRAQSLAALYEEALGHMAAGAWRQAEIALKAVQRIDPAYQESGALLTRVRSELAQLPEQQAMLDPEAVEPGSPHHLTWASHTARDPKVVLTLRHRRKVVGLAFSPDGRFIVTVSAEGAARMWDVFSGREYRRVLHPGLGQILRAAFSPEGRWLATASSDNTARIWDVATGKEQWRLRHTAFVQDVAFSPDGRWLATASRDGTARAWDVTSGKVQWALKHTGMVLGMAFSPDGRWLATASNDNYARIFEVTTREQQHTLRHPAWVLRVTFSPDGRRLATASRDSIGRIWDASSGSEEHLLHHGSWVRGVAFSPDGLCLATVSRDGTTRIWDVASGTELRKLIQAGGVEDVAFNLDGRWLATAGDDKTARIWAIEEGSVSG